jgi:predicted negative regulator of RcsB-dependent stress response
MRSIFDKIKDWIATNQKDIILVTGVVLISLLSFAVGYIVGIYQNKEQIKIEDTSISKNI